MKVYHYTHIERWPEIKSSLQTEGHKTGLVAHRQLGKVNNEAWNTKAVFALLEPKPQAWVLNPYFKETWRRLLKYTGTLLTEIEVNPQTDTNLFVVDRAHLQGFWTESKNDIPQKYLHPVLLLAENAYIKSKVHLNEYLNRESEFNYCLPEIIITEDIPPERVSICPVQPFVERLLQDAHFNLPNYRTILEIPELKELHVLCQQKIAERKISRFA